MVTGIEISSYGSDFKDGTSLIDLLELIAREGGDMRFTISDDGVGIPPDKLLLLRERIASGEMRNHSFVDYRISTAIDVPEKIDTFIVETAQDDGPFGARGIGEHPLVPVIAALANAIYDATGVRVTNPPFSAEKIYMALLEAGVVN